MSRGRIPSAPGIPSIELPRDLPPEDSKPPMSVEAEFLYQTMKRLDYEQAARITGVHRRIDTLSEQVIAGARADADFERRLSEVSATAGKDAGKRSGRVWGALAGPVATALAGLLLAAAAAGLHACGIEVPQPVIEVQQGH